MTAVVLDSADLVKSVVTGEIPVPAGIAEDNAKQEARREAEKKDKPEPSIRTVVESNAKPAKIEKEVEKPAEAKTDDNDPDDIEGEDGLTPREKRDLTAKMQKAIAKRTRALRDAEDFAAKEYSRGQLAEQRAAKLEAELNALKGAKPLPKVEEAKEPTRKDFEAGDVGDKAYWDAMVDFRVDQKFSKAQAEQAQREQERFQAETMAHAQAKLDRAIEIVPDFKEVYEAADIVMPPYMLEAVQASDLMAELVYFFGNNRDKAESISKLTEGLKPGSVQYVKAAQRQLVEIGKIESKLTPFAKEAKSQEDNGDKPSKTETASRPSDKNADKASLETGSTPSKPRIAPVIQPLASGSASQVDEADLGASDVVRTWQKKHGVQLTARKRH